MGSRESRMMGSSKVISDSSIYVFVCGLIAALSHIQFGFTVKRKFNPFNFCSFPFVESCD